MPRHTHPLARAKHGRAEIRQQRERWSNRRWARLKSGEYIRDADEVGWGRHAFARGGWRPLDAEESQLAEALGQAGPVLYLHPEVMRRLPKQLRDYAGTYRGSLSERLQDAPRRLSYGGRELDPWGWNWPRAVQLARSKKRQSTWRREAARELSELELVSCRYCGHYMAYTTDSYSWEDSWEQDDWREQRIWEDWCDGTIAAEIEAAAEACRRLLAWLGVVEESEQEPEPDWKQALAELRKEVS